MEKEIEEKYEKFKTNPLGYLEKLLFCNLANTEKEEISVKYAELLIEIQKIKKDLDDDEPSKP